VSGRHKPTPATCVRDASCGGGGVLSVGTALFVFALVAGIGVVSLALAGRRFAARRVKIPSGTLLAARLFHPPRLALGR